MEPTKKTARLVLFRMSLLLTLILNFSCTPSTDTAATDGEVIQTGEQNSTPSDEVANSTIEGQYIDRIKEIAGNSSCAGYSWQGRGKAPSGYIKGMALTYARSLCRLKTTEVAPTALVNVLSGAAGSSATDALAYFVSTFSSLSLEVNVAGENTLRSLYTLGIGLGMRESSGKYCEGWDVSAGSNRSSSEAEAGLFQSSLDSMGASAELSKLYAEYQASPGKCFLDVFKAGASCASTSILGAGAGAAFQSFTKSCPAFAAEYAMVMLRVRRNHYGPINRKEAEVTTSCNQMLKSVQDLIEGDVYACDEILL